MYANAIHTQLQPLPATTQSRTAGHGRRRRVGQLVVDERRLARFNRLLKALGHATGLDIDQLATFGRTLAATTPGQTTPDWIHHRLQQGELLSRMLGDRDWAPGSEPGGGRVAFLGRVVLGYLRSRDDLIPDDTPGIGRLDDAIVVDVAWPMLAGEAAAYRDFCRLRDAEARLRGCAAGGFRFTRSDWRAARRAEVALQRLRNRIRDSSYLPAAAARFRVH
ncbi:DUF1232 domain-containing protein [Luteimonas sp. BDR2-5]|uniref:DUF1232 domain-containing protein n=1 Tax=Proluteimonas luteida TaxID=2878685 RepID=UPI001E5A1BD0|nr:YkvA family protein [Luteimonas sp. BDR2-5]MCD9028113.1 DUF1232 domain-containing protein [Luteimonas sp. BDR2-5]